MAPKQKTTPRVKICIPDPISEEDETESVQDEIFSSQDETETIHEATATIHDSTETFHDATESAETLQLELENENAIVVIEGLEEINNHISMSTLHSDQVSQIFRWRMIHLTIQLMCVLVFIAGLIVAILVLLSN